MLCERLILIGLSDIPVKLETYGGRPVKGQQGPGICSSGLLLSCGSLNTSPLLNGPTVLVSPPQTLHPLVPLLPSLARQIQGPSIF